MTTQAKTEPIRPDTALEVAPVGDRGKRIRRAVAYAFLIAYALLMFVPFAWMVITSFKTLPDSVRLTIIMPDQLRLVPVYAILRTLGLLQGPLAYAGVVVVLAIAASSIFLLRQYFLSIPRDLEEAAKIDGAGHFTTFARVMLPLATPAVAAVSILQFQGAWNSFFWPLVLMAGERAQWTLPLGLTIFRVQFNTQWPPLMAVAVMGAIPNPLLCVFFQPY